MIPLRDLQRQYEALKDKIDPMVACVLQSGSFIMGESVVALESRLAKYVGVKHCVTCASGTDALVLALTALGVKQGDAVFVPDFTFFATAEAVCHVGATPVLVDVDESTYNMSAESLLVALRQVVEDGRLVPRAVIPVDLFGQTANYEALREVSDSYGLLVVEDGAQGFGATLNGRRACSLGDISTTSFFPAKPLGCYGDGGAIFTDNEQWADALRSLRLHGRGGDKYHNVRVGFNSRLDALQAAVLQVKLDTFERFELSATQKVADVYGRCLKGLIECPNVPDRYTSSWAQYTIRFASRQQRDAVQNHLKEHDIASAVYYPVPMHQQPALKGLSIVCKDECRNAQSLSDTVLSIPIHPYLTDNEVGLVIESIKQAL